MSMKWKIQNKTKKKTCKIRWLQHNQSFNVKKVSNFGHGIISHHKIITPNSVFCFGSSCLLRGLCFWSVYWCETLWWTNLFRRLIKYPWTNKKLVPETEASEKKLSRNHGRLWNKLKDGNWISTKVSPTFSHTTFGSRMSWTLISASFTTITIQISSLMSGQWRFVLEVRMRENFTTIALKFKNRNWL